MHANEPKLSPWQKAQAAAEKHSCSCDLREGMNWVALRKLGAGCTHDHVCLVLRTYREAVGVPSADDYVNEVPNVQEESCS